MIGIQNAYQIIERDTEWKPWSVDKYLCFSFCENYDLVINPLAREYNDQSLSSLSQWGMLALCALCNIVNNTTKCDIVMWMQQGRICILGKIEFSIDNENADKNAQVKLYFMPELK